MSLGTLTASLCQWWFDFWFDCTAQLQAVQWTSCFSFPDQEQLGNFTLPGKAERQRDRCCAFVGWHVVVCRETAIQILGFGLVGCSVAVCRETAIQILGFGLVKSGPVCCDIRVSGFVKQWVLVLSLLTGIPAQAGPSLFVLLGCQEGPSMYVSLHVFLQSLFLHLCFVEALLSILHMHYFMHLAYVVSSVCWLIV